MVVFIKLGGDFITESLINVKKKMFLPIYLKPCQQNGSMAMLFLLPPEISQQL